MSVKFIRSGSPQSYIQSTGAAARTFPNTDWCFGAVIVFDGPLGGYGAQAQYLASTGGFSAAGSFNLVYEPTDSANAPGTVHVYLDASAGPFAQSMSGFVAGKAYLFVVQRSGTTVTMRHCPVLAALPTDGSAVVAGSASTVGSVSTALTGGGNFTIGNRSDLADRAFGQSLAHLFRLDGTTLTDFEIAKLAYGMSPSDIGKTAAIYVRANDRLDLIDTGAQANTFSATPTTITNGTDPAFGYSTPNAAPSITGNPSISGDTSVGTTSTVTSALMTGTPAPTASFQWKIDGIAISGATGSTYAKISSDLGKTLTVTQTATNGVGTPATATSAGVVVTAAATGTITAAELVAERIYQRISGAAVVALSGTWTGATQPTIIEYQLYAPDGTTVQKAWATTGATIAVGNTWSATPSIPQPTNGKKYLIQYRSKDSGGAVLATSTIKSNRFGIGDIHGFIGSSSAEKAFYTDSGTGFTLDPEATSRYDGSWYTINAGCAIQIASSLSAQAGVPVALFDYGIGGSVLTDWNTNGYSQWNDFANGVTSQGGKLAGCLITVGSNDAAYGQVSSRASHATNLRALITRVRTLTGQASLPACLIGFNRRTSYNVSAAAYAICADYVRMAENDVGDDAGVCSVQTLDFQLSSDGIHLAFVDTGYPAWGRRAAYQFGAFLNGTYRRGPKISQMTLSGNVVTVTLTHRGSTDFTPTTGITGFTALDSSGTAIPINSAIRTNATTITLTCTTAPAKVQYLEGGAPEVGTPVFGNTATALPMTVETDMLLAATADTTAPTMVGSLVSSSVTTTGFTLTWQASTDAVGVTGYEVSIDSGSTYVDAGNVLTVTKTGLAASTLYNTRVRAYDAAGNRSAALSLAVTTTAVVAPGGTLAQSVRTLGAISPTSVTLGATPVSFTYSQNKSQSVILYNKSGSSVVVNILGSAAPIVIIPNTGGIAVNLATGWNVTVPTGFTRLELDRAFAFLVGATTITANTENAVLAALVV